MTPVINILFMDTLPSSPNIGDRYICVWPGLTNTTTPAWGQIAQATTTTGAWIYFTPVDGDEVYSKYGQCKLHWYGSAQVWSTPPMGAATATLQIYDPVALATANQSFADSCSAVRTQFALGRYRVDGGPNVSGSTFVAARSSSPAFWTRDDFGSSDFQVSGTTTRNNSVRGQACERAATNWIPNSTMSGAVVGTVGGSGSLPNGWGNWTSGGVVVVVNSITTIGNDGGYQVLDVTITRGSFSSNELFLSLTAVGSTSPQVTPVRGGVAFTCGMDVEQNSGISDLRLRLQEFASNGTSVGSTYAMPFFYSVGALTKRSIWRAVASGSRVAAFVIVDLPDSSSAFTLQFEIAIPQMEDAADELDYTSWIPTSSGSVTRNAEMVTLDVPPWTANGTFDVFEQGENYGQWAFGVTPCSNQIALSALSYQSGIIDVIAMTASTM